MFLGGISSAGPGNRLTCPRKCGRSYKWKKHLNYHLKYVCGVDPKFKCPYCSRTFNEKPALKKHAVIVHKVLIDKIYFDNV